MLVSITSQATPLLAAHHIQREEHDFRSHFKLTGPSSHGWMSYSRELVVSRLYGVSKMHENRVPFNSKQQTKSESYATEFFIQTKIFLRQNPKESQIQRPANHTHDETLTLTSIFQAWCTTARVSPPA